MAEDKERNDKKVAALWQTVRRLVLDLPGTEEGTSYGTPAFRVRGKLFVRLHQSGHSIVVMIDLQERAAA